MKNQISFATKAEAVAYLDNRSDLELLRDGKTYAPCDVYYLRHNEYSSPEFFPRKYGKEWGIAVETFCYDDDSKPRRLCVNGFGEFRF